MPPKAAITYLCQVRHASYGRDSLAMLQDSLALLHRNFNDEAKHDVLLFHTGDFGEAEQLRVLAPFARGGTVRFERVPDEHWRLPLDVAPQLDGGRNTKKVASRTRVHERERA